MALRFWRRRGAALILGACGLLVALAALAPAKPMQAAPAAGLPHLQLQAVASGFTLPSDVTHAGDGRLFVVELGGAIRVVEQDGTVRPTPFLDISERVCGGGENGLLGLAFHPHYPHNGFFFVNYTTPRSGSCEQPLSRISRFQVSSDPNVADAASEVVILAVEQPYDNHNAGDLAFGPDGYLYVPLGDGGSAGDPGNRAQDGSTLLGKLLRIAPSVGAPTEPPYTIPADNPFVSVPEVRDEIWALGLRNPWRISFDRVTGDLYIADVGQSAREEINFQPASSVGGENYGWRCYEGSLPYNLAGCFAAEAYVFPVTEYGHDLGNVITGGFVYRGDDFPTMQGYYLFADFGSGRFWALWRKGAGTWQRAELLQVSNTSFSTFGEGVDGELYVASFAFDGPSTLYRVVDTAPQPFRQYLPLVAR